MGATTKRGSTNVASTYADQIRTGRFYIMYPLGQIAKWPSGTIICSLYIYCILVYHWVVLSPSMLPMNQVCKLTGIIPLRIAYLSVIKYRNTEIWAYKQWRKAGARGAEYPLTHLAGKFLLTSYREEKGKEKRENGEEKKENRKREGENLKILLFTFQKHWNLFWV